MDIMFNTDVIVKDMKGGKEDMTKKRFVDYFDKDHNYIIQDLQNEDEYQVGFVNCDEDVFLKLVNKIADENEQLRKENDMLSCELSVSANKEISRNCRIAELEEENKQLKQFKEDVFNKIDMHLRMLPTARDNEFNEENGDPSLYTGAIYMIETLKKELKE